MTVVPVDEAEGRRRGGVGSGRMSMRATLRLRGCRGGKAYHGSHFLLVGLARLVALVAARHGVD